MKRLATIFAFLFVVIGAAMVGGFLLFGETSDPPRRPVTPTPAEVEPGERPEVEQNEPDIRDDTREDTPDRTDQPPDTAPDGDEDSPTADRSTADDEAPDNNDEAADDPVTATITLEGRVRDDDGNPVHAATITVYYNAAQGDSEAPMQKISAARTDGDGFFRGEARLTFPGRDRDVEITVQAQKESGLHSEETTLRVRADNTYGGLDMVIPRGSSLTGRVVNNRFEPVHNAIVSAQWTDGQRKGKTHKTRADERGEFAIEDMPPGTYVVTVEAEGYQLEGDPREAEVQLGVDHELSGDLTLAPVTGVRLQLMSNHGQPSGTFEVTFYNAREEATKANGRADNEGRAIVSPVPDDAIEMEIKMRGYEDSGRVAVVVIEDDHADAGQVNLTSKSTDND